VGSRPGNKTEGGNCRGYDERRSDVKETNEDLSNLQRLLNDSYAAGGAHLREVITQERRLDAAALCAELIGMRLLVLATVTADGRPITSPVDGIFYRGSFYFGSSPNRFVSSTSPSQCPQRRANTNQLTNQLTDYLSG
jgi:hypothetical protein